MNRFQNWLESHQNAIEHIKSYLAMDGEVGHLCRWLFETKANPYGITPDYADAFYTAEGFNNMCGNIHHALLDDGDITFYAVNRSPSMVFCDRHTEYFERFTKPSYSSHLIFDIPHEVTFFKDAYEFTKAFDIYNKAWLKKCFFSDAKRMGVEFAVKHYDTEENKDSYDDSWAQEFENRNIEEDPWL